MQGHGRDGQERTPGGGRRGFTLAELIVTIAVIGVLAAVAVAAVATVSDRGRAAAAQANLRQIATAVVSHHLQAGAPYLTRAMFLEALASASVEVTDGLAATGWVVTGKDDAPDVDGVFAVGFDRGPGTAASDEWGTRAVVLTWAGDQIHARVIVYGGTHAGGGPGEDPPLPGGGDTALPGGGHTGPRAGDGAYGTVPAGTSPAAVLADADLMGLTWAAVEPPDPGVGVPVDGWVRYFPIDVQVGVVTGGTVTLSPDGRSATLQVTVERRVGGSGGQGTRTWGFRCYTPATGQVSQVRSGALISETTGQAVVRESGLYTSSVECAPGKVVWDFGTSSTNLWWTSPVWVPQP